MTLVAPPADSHGYGLASLLINPELSIAKREEISGCARQVMTVILIHKGYTITPYRTVATYTSAATMVTAITTTLL